MIRSNGALLISIAAILSSFVVACSVKEEVKDERLSYQYNVNGCDTGAKTFGDLKSYCAALIDDEMNNNCAKSVRLQEYDLKCSSLAQKNEHKSPSSPETVPAPPATSAEVSTKPETSTHTEVTTPQSEDSKSKPKEVVLESHFEKMVRVSPQDTGEELLSSLEGKIIVASISPKIDKTLRLDRAESSIFGAENDLGKCELMVNEYKIEADNSAIHFQMIGLDKKERLDGSSCISHLSILAMSGFVMEFINVPVGGALSQDVIPKVTLKVEVKE